MTIAPRKIPARGWTGHWWGCTRSPRCRHTCPAAAGVQVPSLVVARQPAPRPRRQAGQQRRRPHPRAQGTSYRGRCAGCCAALRVGNIVLPLHCEARGSAGWSSYSCALSLDIVCTVGGCSIAWRRIPTHTATRAATTVPSRAEVRSSRPSLLACGRSLHVPILSGASNLLHPPLHVRSLSLWTQIEVRRCTLSLGH